MIVDSKTIENTIIGQILEANRLLQFLEDDKEMKIITRDDVAYHLKTALKNLMIGRSGYDKAINIKDFDTELLNNNKELKRIFNNYN